MVNRVALNLGDLGEIGGIGGLGGLTPSNKLKELDDFKRRIEIEPNIIEDLEELLKKKGIPLPDIFKPDRPILEIPGKKPPLVIDPVLPNPAAPDKPVLEIDTKLQLLLNAIPIANPGNIITSEYHNALRDAVRALASRIGLNVNPTAEFSILSFSPDFLQRPASGDIASDANWDIKFNRAAIPERIPNTGLSVRGGMVVQLPDNALILQMIVRGERLGKEAAAPKEINVRLNRQRFGKEKTSTVLIDADLKGVKDGYFEQKGSVKLSDKELDSDNATAQATIADRKRVNNETHLYFVTADWSGDKDSAKFEIHSIQIFCAA